MRLHTGPVRLGIGLLILAVVATGTGSSFIPPVRVLAALFGQGSGPDAIIITTLRLPRVLVAMLAGMALAIAGAILQRVARNPMASPSILGITDGAALGVMTFLWLFSDSASNLAVSIHWQPAAAATGALAFALLVAILTRLDPRGTQEPMRMILYGISLAALAKAAVVLMMILGPVHRAAQAMTWMIGSVSAAHWSDVVTLFLGLCAMVPALILLRLSLRQLALDPQSAASTGLHLVRAQAVLLAVAVLLTALAVSHVGAMGYVGLIAPHIAHRLCGQFTPGYLFASAICGAILLVGADMLSRLLAQPLEIPAGAVTAVIGTPLFLYLLMKGRGAHV